MSDLGESSDLNRGGGHKYIPVQTRGLAYLYKLVNLIPFNATVEFACNSVPVASAGWPPIAVLRCKMRSLLAVAVLLTMLVTLSTAQTPCKFQRLQPNALLVEA